MATPFTGDEGVSYERVDDLTVNVYVDGPGDTTVRPSDPARVKARALEREQIAELIERVRLEQEKLNARNGRIANPGEPTS